MLMMEPFGSRLQLIERFGSDSVGQNCVVAARHWEQPFGTADHEHRIEVIANGGTDRAKNDTLSEPAMTPSSDVEFGPQGTLEHTVARHRLDGIKSSQAHLRILDPSKRLLFVIRPRCVLALFTQQRLQQRGPSRAARR
jgi:hypothetical protein